MDNYRLVGFEKDDLGFPRVSSLPPSIDGSPDSWTWNPLQCGCNTVILDDSVVIFHPTWSNSTSGVRGTRVVNGGIYYWEIAFGQRVFGSAMMVGIGSSKSALESCQFEPLVGSDCFSYGLSHKGYIYHNGEQRQYCAPFVENQPVTVGVLFNGYTGTLSFYKDGVYLGVAFRNIKMDCELYPMVSSTAAKTAMRIQHMRRAYQSLKDQCRDVILLALSKPSDVNELQLPNALRSYIFLQSWKTGKSVH